MSCKIDLSLRGGLLENGGPLLPEGLSRFGPAWHCTHGGAALGVWAM